MYVWLSKITYERRNSYVLDNRWPLSSPAATKATDFLDRGRGMTYVMTHTTKSLGQFEMLAVKWLKYIFHKSYFMITCISLEKEKERLYFIVLVFLYSCLLLDQNRGDSPKKSVRKTCILSKNCL